MNPALQMHLRRVEDQMETRGYLPDELLRPGSEVSTAGQIFGEDNGIVAPSQRMLSLAQDASGQWSLQRGWLENVEISGTGPISETRSTRIVLEAVILYEYAFIALESGETTYYSHYKTGRYRIDRARVFTQDSDKPVPPSVRPFPGSESPDAGEHTEISYRELNSFDAEGQPAFVVGQGWLQVGPNLSF